MRFRLLAGRHAGADHSKKPRILKDPVSGDQTKVYPDKVWMIGDVIETDKDLATLFGKEKFERLDAEPDPLARRSIPVPDEQTFAFPHGQVLQGHQVTGSAPPADEAQGLLKGESRAVGESDMEALRQDLGSSPEAEHAGKGKATKVKQPTLEERHPGLENMTNAQLRQIAQEEEIELGEARSKQDILEVLRTHGH